MACPGGWAGGRRPDGGLAATAKKAASRRRMCCSRSNEKAELTVFRTINPAVKALYNEYLAQSMLWNGQKNCCTVDSFCMADAAARNYTLISII